MSLLDLPDDWLLMIINQHPPNIWALKQVCTRLKKLIETRAQPPKFMPQIIFLKSGSPYYHTIIFRNTLIPNKVFCVWPVGFVPKVIDSENMIEVTNFMSIKLIRRYEFGLIRFDDDGRVIYPIYANHFVDGNIFRVKYLPDNAERPITDQQLLKYYEPERWKSIYEKLILELDESKVFMKMFEAVINNKLT